MGNYHVRFLGGKRGASPLPYPVLDTSRMEPDMAINDEKRYEFITEQIRYVNEKIIEAFTLFVKLTSAIVAGIVWLLIQNLKHETRILIGPVIPWLFLLLGVTCILLIIINLRSWWGYRKAESTLGEQIGTLPIFLFSSLIGNHSSLTVCIY